MNPGITSPGSTILYNLTHCGFGATKEKPSLIFQGCVEVRFFWKIYPHLEKKKFILNILLHKIIVLIIVFIVTEQFLFGHCSYKQFIVPSHFILLAAL